MQLQEEGLSDEGTVLVAGAYINHMFGARLGICAVAQRDLMSAEGGPPVSAQAVARDQAEGRTSFLRDARQTAGTHPCLCQSKPVQCYVAGKGILVIMAY